MPTFADAYISSLGYLRPYVLFENNGELARKASARERARRTKKKSPTPTLLYYHYSQVCVSKLAPVN